LRHNISDSYQTPFLGIGSNMLTLPSNWIRPIVPQVSATALNNRAFSPTTGDAPSLTAPAGPSAAQLAILANIRAQDLAAFQNVNLQTKRSNSSVAFDYQFGPHWEFTSSFKHELAQGLRPLDGIVNASGAAGQVGGDSGVTLAEQINSTTDQLNLAVNYHGDQFFGQIGYYGSLFDNSTKSMNWQDPNSALGKPVFGTISTPPSNQFHEINFVGGYNFSPSTKLVVNGAYGRNSQNDAFLTRQHRRQTLWSLPKPSTCGSRPGRRRTGILPLGSNTTSATIKRQCGCTSSRTWTRHLLTWREQHPQPRQPSRRSMPSWVARPMAKTPTSTTTGH
jgi:hypothetical protein